MKSSKKGQTTFQREKQGNVRSHKLNNRETIQVCKGRANSSNRLLPYRGERKEGAKAIKQLLPQQTDGPSHRTSTLMSLSQRLGMTRKTPEKNKFIVVLQRATVRFLSRWATIENYVTLGP